MNFYVRTSLRVGPFRFTLSQAGMAVSTAIPGLRAGMGPRGNVVRMGRGAVSYRTVAPGRDVVMHDVVSLVPAQPSDIVQQLQKAAGRRPYWPFALAALLVAGLVTGRFGLVVVAVGLPGVLWVALRDRAARAVVVMYDVTDEAAARFDHLVNAITGLQRAHGFWLITASGAITTTHQFKVNAGASNLLRRLNAGARLAGPRILITNVAVPTLASGSLSVHFLPDRVLIRDGRHIADLAYQHLQLGVEHTRFIEAGPVPRDGTVVDSTWRYVNVKGGPDRRFKNNARLPILLYGRLTLRSHSGLNLVWDASQVTLVHAVANALHRSIAARPPVVHS
ncbi:hypothetical protein E1295_13590 [Nonomuraea mesophila]|uniref:Uncharacterized protein n=1 Tax=Nonomuraea mesophila TaxID=2530382 RepID=A0A4R5FRF5_9ACTN|nr:DUF4236 domain-containing protein [Nonomuraea mesophila]TDE55710.1 hypothetical protein E1295_13590 [Nonomuraea mesophila]